MSKAFYVYMLSSERNGTIYTGVTSYLVQRTWQHKEKLVPGFSSTHGVSMLVWYEAHVSAETALTRERQLKKWRRAWKIRLIEEMNPYWRDLYSEICK
jgi:putative endonuclease